ncbi:MAG: AsnC family transcriptional regulator [Candidatus Accumulibacter phosphatis]|jgi:DNA-binding Lrp family transcriptional regulator|uniref:siroheme decarboxylase n=1 Tax=Candidatus Accumulibacter contiguus TaxID=2954381 RepID=A0ABX1TAT5_9PROT|nr:AsnC family transcriptional regulator [Candidatus Accumulibacter contiguus]MBL8408068.1 AsnC family transcriptional regulator [Accumulibacter sp.]NMQ06076.1 Lrp/AsnC family transcriptional regulator [Candidatus Accumulibacter contiguus]
MREAASIDATDRAIIDGLQGGFPICERPYAEIAERLGISETELLERLQRMLTTRVLTRFGPMFQVERMGGAFVLAAMRVPDAEWLRVLEIVNAFPEVAHNYRRESDRNCEFNMWFVLATETADGIDTAVRRIEEASGLPVFPFPKLQEYFVEMKLAVRS